MAEILLPPPTGSQLVPLLDELPALPRGRLIEVMGNAATAFAALAAGRTEGPIIWILNRQAPDMPYVPGLRPFLDPARLCHVWGQTPQDILWATEEALRSAAPAVVIAELTAPPSFTEGRRLQLAAQQGGALTLALLPRHGHTTPATMRWICDSRPSTSFHSTHWHWHLNKNKIGTTNITTKGHLGAQDRWNVVWDCQTGRLHLATAMEREPCRAPM